MNTDEQNGELFIEKPREEQKPEIRIPETPVSENFSVPARRCCGDFLRREREKLGMTPQEVYEAIKIKPERIVSLENEDFDALPEPIYIMAYIKRLCEFYHVKNSVEKELLESLELNKTVEVPEDFSKTLKGYSVDEENTKRDRRMILGAIILLLTVLVLIGVGITLAVIHLNAPAKQPFADDGSVEEMMVKLQPAPKLQMTEL